jgi:hypothetical protein
MLLVGMWHASLLSSSEVISIVLCLRKEKKTIKRQVGQYKDAVLCTNLNFECCSSTSLLATFTYFPFSLIYNRFVVITMTSSTKTDTEQIERLGNTQTRETYYEKDDIAALSSEHREYLMHRHGTLDLDPVPAFGDADPYNWPTWKVCIYSIIDCPECARKADFENSRKS